MQVGTRLLERLRCFAEHDPGIGDVRGLGAMVAIELVIDRTTKVPDKARTARVLSESLRRGLVHGWNSSIDAANLAVVMGFRQIVLVGVDLYDHGYFWLADGARRANVTGAVGSPFPTAAPVVDLFRRWRELLEPDGVRLMVQNPRSLLAGVLETFSW